MIEHVIYLRGDFVQAAIQSFAGPEFAQNARIVLALKQDVIVALAAALKTQPGFADFDILTQQIRKFVDNDGDAKRIANVAGTIQRFCKEAGLTTKEFAKRLPDLVKNRTDTPNEQDKKPENTNALKTLSREETDELGRRVDVIFGSESAFTRQQKAESLRKATGHPLEDFQIICDLRPVYDDQRAEVTGMFPTSTLRIVVTDDSGLPVSLEARLTNKQVEDLEKKVGLALVKLRVIKDLLTQKGIAQPSFEKAGEGEK